MTQREILSHETRFISQEVILKSLFLHTPYCDIVRKRRPSHIIYGTNVWYIYCSRHWIVERQSPDLVTTCKHSEGLEILVKSSWSPPSWVYSSKKIQGSTYYMSSPTLCVVMSLRITSLFKSFQCIRTEQFSSRGGESKKKNRWKIHRYVCLFFLDET